MLLLPNMLSEAISLEESVNENLCRYLGVFCTLEWLLVVVVKTDLIRRYSLGYKSFFFNSFPFFALLSSVLAVIHAYFDNVGVSMIGRI